MEEERRLCYVGVTRAKERLYLLYTFSRTLYGETEVREPSRFLDDVPSQLVEGRGKERGRQPAGRQQSLGLEPGRYLRSGEGRVTSFSPGGRPPAIKGPAAEPDGVPAGRSTGGPLSRSKEARRETPAAQYATGDEVKHEVFGRGIVVESKTVGGDEQVTVAFAGVGLKRLMVSMAPMEKLQD
jgi:DNA helicase-2/ATP-dependent DNA helicase PcrA